MDAESGTGDIYTFKNKEVPSSDDRESLNERQMLDVKETQSSPATQDNVNKRSFIEAANDSEEGDDESRRKKQKHVEPGKENIKNVAGKFSSNKNGSGSEKCSKVPVNTKNTTPNTAGSNNSNNGNNINVKTAYNVNTVSSDGKSPVPVGSAPKLGNSSNTGNGGGKINTPETSVEDNDDSKSNKVPTTNVEVPTSSAPWIPGPKVPPLKIVIPSQSSSVEQDQGTRNGKNGTRHQALPYVVASSNSSDSSSEKDVIVGAVSCKEEVSSTDTNVCVKTEEKKDVFSSGNGSGDEKYSAQNQRILRSSYRNGGSSNGTNNSGSSTTPPPVSISSNVSSPVNVSGNTSVPEQSLDHSPSPTSNQRQTPSPPSSISNAPSESSSAVIAKSPPSNTSAIQEEKSSESTETSTSQQQPVSVPNPVELHPRKRKMKQSKESQVVTTTTPNPETTDANCSSSSVEVHPPEQPVSNCYQLYLNIRKQVERRRKNLFPVQPKPPQGFKDYLMNRCTYVLAGNASHLSIQHASPPVSLPEAMKELFVAQEKERYRLRMQHVIEKEKLVLSVEQEILRVHGRAARALANQSMPFSVCTILKDEEIYNFITPEQEEKDRNARSRYNGRLFLSWLQDVDDKWEKIKEAMLLRHHKEADSLNAVQKMDWEWKMKELGLCDYKVKPDIDDVHVPVVHVSDDFDLLPA